MIVDLPSTTTTALNRRLIALRNSVGAMAMGRVLTLLVSTDDQHADEAIEAASAATRQHPARIIVVVHSTARGANRLDGQIRVGGDAGASEVVVLRLYGQLTHHADAVVRPLLLPDSPIVAWWPEDPPTNVAASRIGAMAQRRITDAGNAPRSRQRTELNRRAKHYSSGDTDLAWTRITRWRAVLAAALDRAPYESVTGATVTAEVDSPSADLLAGWLAHSLQIKVRRARSEAGSGIRSVRLVRESGPTDLVMSSDAAAIATLAQPGQPVRQVPITVPNLTELLAQELRRLVPDQVYADALIAGRSQLRTPITRTKAIAAGDAPDDSTSVPDRVRAHEAERATGDPVDVIVESDPSSLATAVARALTDVVTRTVAADGVAHVALTGGSMGGATIAALAGQTDPPLDPEVWRHVHLWWGDERFVPSGDKDRNDQQAEDAGLSAIPVEPAHVHRVAGADLGPVRRTARAAAAADYADELARYAADPGAAVPHPQFAVVMLGVGPDAHVASLFPGRDELTVTNRAAVPVAQSPKPPPDRVSLTVPVLSSAAQVWFVAAGGEKAEAIVLAQMADRDPLIPASWVRGTERTVWWLDDAAAAPPSGTDQG